MPQGGPHEETRQALPPPGRRYEEQVDEVAVVEVAGPDAEEADDLTVLDGNQAGSFPDERPDLLAPAGALGIDDHDGTDVGGLRCAEFSHGEPSRWLAVAELHDVAVVSGAAV
jgi:hypothetical protein